jgi:hypothetical protein
MINEDSANSSSIGIDIGTSRIVVARTSDKRFHCDSQLNAFISLPYSRLTENLLKQENVFHETIGRDIVVAGNDAEKFAEVFHVETRRPMLGGVLNPQEPHSLAVVKRIVSKLAGPATVQNQKAFFSMPAPAPECEGTLAYHEASCQQILRELGYEATSINEGLAVVFGEMESSNYTGIGISCGSGLCNVCLAVLSLPVVSFSVAKAGDFIDQHSATATGDVATRIRVQKEQSFALNGFTSDRTRNALNVYYGEVVRNLVNALVEHLSSSKRVPKLDNSIPLVISGGTAMPKGFLELFRKELGSRELPVQISDVRMAPEPLNSTARGALMAALCQ